MHDTPVALCYMTILRFNATARLHNAIGPIKTEGSSSAFPHTSTPSIEASKAKSFVAVFNNFFQSYMKSAL